MRMHAAYLILGSNIDPERNLPAAVALLREWGAILRVSSVWESPPVDGSDQPNYLNAAVLLQTSLDLRALRDDVISPIEERLDRRRDPGNRYAARTIDIDVALFDDLAVEVDGRTLPDPDILTRPFVALPLAEVDADYVHPLDGRTLGQIAECLGSTGLVLRDDVILSRDRASE